MDYETIDIHDERAKELAQILMNDKAIAILHLVEDQALSISEISRELSLPISTVSYHIDKMLKVGLIEVAGKKYGKRLQEVKLYRASNRPILLVPRRNVAKVRKKAVMSFEKLHVISLGLAGLVAAGVYAAARNVLPPVSSGGAPESITQSAVDNVSMMVASERATVPSATNTSTESVLYALHSTVPRSGLEAHATAVSVGLAIAAFILTFLLISYIMKRRS
ncbi:ArsR/SmtB family transcription factor [Thermococcus aciditolerans]|uniref:Helix-turn-helix transcriptional regulator n=1 Tax=Thermococcus aciditolerans TaxID=2598455 RepID=A0A5C0SJH7_9EURY|nr:helix-turn-helix domain-containing protein [Thermococcus aciditolerans]QEK13867.1 helix-turn-helix transcriptional regulator [Thermococcus aciditolerans]